MASGEFQEIVGQSIDFTQARDDTQRLLDVLARAESDPVNTMAELLPRFNAAQASIKSVILQMYAAPTMDHNQLMAAAAATTESASGMEADYEETGEVDGSPADESEEHADDVDAGVPVVDDSLILQSGPDSAATTTTSVHSPIGATTFAQIHVSPDDAPSALDGSAQPPAHLRRSTGKRRKDQPPEKCQKCGISKTPEWRRGPDGRKSMCNACGLQYSKQRRKEVRVPFSNTQHRASIHNIVETQNTGGSTTPSSAEPPATRMRVASATGSYPMVADRTVYGSLSPHYQFGPPIGGGRRQMSSPAVVVTTDPSMLSAQPSGGLPGLSAQSFAAMAPRLGFGTLTAAGMHLLPAQPPPLLHLPPHLRHAQHGTQPQPPSPQRGQMGGGLPQ